MSEITNTMQSYFFQIDNKQTTASIRKEFHDHFPFLKVEFFRDPCIKRKGSARDKMILTDEPVYRLQRKKFTGKIHFTGQTTVAALEQMFKDNLEICVQVFRKSGNVWLETTSTDDWSLQQQNEEGRSLAQHLKIEKENPDDRDMY
jgi:hypothetical protein